MSLLQLEYDVRPFTFADNLNWSFKSQITKFIKRFWKETYKEEERKWIEKLVVNSNIKVKSKFVALSKLL